MNMRDAGIIPPPQGALKVAQFSQNTGIKESRLSRTPILLFIVPRPLNTEMAYKKYAF